MKGDLNNAEVIEAFLDGLDGVNSACNLRSEDRVLLSYNRPIAHLREAGRILIMSEELFTKPTIKKHIKMVRSMSTNLKWDKN